MSVTRLSKFLTLCLVVFAVIGCSAASGGEGSDDLKKQVEALAKRVATLEQQITTLKAGGAAQPNAEAENKATAAYREIDALVNQGKIDQAKTKLTAFNKEFAGTRTARQAQRLSQELAVVGKTSPTDWGIDKWFQGEKEFNLKSDKATLIVFWETWCPHCRREVPKLQAMYDTYKGKGLQVLAATKVTKSSTEETVAQFIDQQKLGYPVAKENGSLSNYFGVRGIPAAALLKDGKVVWRGHPAKLTDDMLKGFL